MDKAFIQAVNDNNLLRVRLLLTNELLLDPRGESFNEMLLFARTNIPNLFEVNIEANYSIPQQNNWDINFLFVVKNDLDNNFSEKIPSLIIFNFETKKYLIIHKTCSKGWRNCKTNSKKNS